MRLRPDARLVLPLVLLLAASAAAQVPGKRPLTHDDYDGWPSLSSVTTSPDGSWVAYTINPQQGDRVLEVRQVDGDTVHRHPLGGSPQFAADGRFLVFRISPSEEEQRRARIEKLREAIAAGKERFEEPKKDEDANLTKVGIIDLKTGALQVIERVESYQLAADAGFVAYVPKPEKKKEPEKKEDAKEGEEAAAGGGRARPGAAAGPAGPRGGARGARGGRGARGAVRPGGPAGAGTPSGDENDDAKKGFQPRDGKPLVVRELETGTEQRFESVLSFRFVADDRWLLYDVQKKAEKEPAAKADQEQGEEHGEAAEGAEPEVAKPEAAKPEAAKPAEPIDQGLFAHELATGRRVELLGGPAQYGGYVTDKEDKRLALWSNIDDLEAEEPQVAIYLWDFTGGPAHRLMKADAPGIPQDRRISKSGLGFSRDGTVLTFAIEGHPEKPLPPVLPEDKVTLDLWHWKDGSIQPMQARGRGRGTDRWSCVSFVEDGRVVVLGDEVLPSMRLITPDGSRAIATDSTPYEALASWDGRYSDVWVVNTTDGSRKKVLTRLRGSASPSPTGRFLTWFDDKQWHAIDLATNEVRTLTARIDAAFWREDDDRPEPDGAYGVAGWLEDDTAVVLYDKYDLWKVDLRSGEATCVTDGYGRANRITMRYVAIDLEGEEEEGEEPTGEMVRFGRDRDNDRAMPETILLSGLDERSKATSYFVDSTLAVERPRRIVQKDARIGGLRKPKKADRFFYTLESYAQFPDLWTASLEFQDEKQLTDANPMLREVRWGNAQLVEWLSGDGIPLQGKLVVPDGFDPNRKYPMMVYFYERLSNNLHRHVSPQPGTSPNAAYYVSNGYLWFEPDIVYREGYPGESALKCVVPGVQALIARGFVDEKAIGIAGHSWGGYQTAYLVTKTDLFAAAESGAPVSNMFSAYGGIRWGSGMSRQWQYEQSQSRIGGTPWEYPLRYLENSPIFFADKVNTPVLILHNDEDGAVPWYQGIEYFMALRRLGKETYLFNYVGADHGLRKRQNQRDWTRRMQEFFDHHLKGKPAPQWMIEGVKYEDRDREKIEFAPSFIEASSEPIGTEAAKPVEAVGTGSEGGGGE